MNRSRLTTIAAAAALTLAAAPAAHAAPPANDLFGSAVTLSGVAKPAAAPYSLVGATKQISEPANGGGQTVWFKWTPNDSGAAFADVCGAPTNHNVKVYRLKAGMPIMVYNLEGARIGDPQAIPLPASSFCRFRWRAEEAKTYYVQVDTSSGVTSEHELIVDQDTSAPAAPAFEPLPDVTGPSVDVKFSGAGASFFCSSEGNPFQACSSPHHLSGLADGYHGLSVRAMDAHGNVGPFSSRSWKVETPKAIATPVQPTGGEQPPVNDPSFVDVPVQGSGEPTGPTTGVVTGVSPQPPIAGACRITLTAPKKIRRAKLRAKGLKVTIAATGEACSPDVFLTQGRRTLAKRTLKLGKVTLRGRRAARGKVTVVSGATRLTVKVV